MIDSRCVDFDKVANLAIRGPMVAVGRPADPMPWNALSFAPLLDVARAYAAAGAEVHNLTLDQAMEVGSQEGEGGLVSVTG